jgi:hypothetical protein
MSSCMPPACDTARDDVNDFGTFFSDIVEHSTRETVVEDQPGDEEMEKKILRRLTLYLIPLDEVLSEAMVAAHIKPNLILTMRPGKPVRKLIQHLETKWTGMNQSAPFGSVLRLFAAPTSAADVTPAEDLCLGACKTVKQIFDQLGKPDIFTLKYAWVA